jgi:ribosomal protein S18 acetylase RimI-like enzyme
MDDETTNLADRISLRPVEMPADEEFLIDLYYTTRYDIEQAPIDEVQKRTLSLMQYTAQKHHYEKHYSDSSHDIILLDGINVGRLWTARYETEILGIDMAIMPEHRNKKIGTFLLQNLFDEATRTNRVFNFHVLKTNAAAIRLYKRMKCKFTESDAPTHFKMRWHPQDKLIASK